MKTSLVGFQKDDRIENGRPLVFVDESGAYLGIKRNFTNKIDKKIHIRL